MLPAAFIPPELATLVDRAPEGDAWIHEIKLDGYRMALRLAGGKGTMLTRRGLDWTARFTPIAAAVASAIPARSAYIEGRNGRGNPSRSVSFELPPP